MRKTPGKGQSHALLVIADFNSIHKPPVLFSFRSMSRNHPETVDPFQFSSHQSGVAYEGSYSAVMLTPFGLA
jgi:hypothetical protein